ncbi:hypothetical protein MHYP_G00121150 [Metynnis hypsauchen]
MLNGLTAAPLGSQTASESPPDQRKAFNASSSACSPGQLSASVSARKGCSSAPKAGQVPCSSLLKLNVTGRKWGVTELQPSPQAPH